MYEWRPHSSAVYNHQKWRNYPPFHACFTKLAKETFVFTSSCHIHYNMCDGGVEDNADICDHEAQIQVCAIVVVVIMA